MARYFCKTATIERKIAVRIEEELAKQVAVEVVELSSDEENSSEEEEVKILTEKSSTGSVEESSSESSGEMKLTRLLFIFSIL